MTVLIQLIESANHHTLVFINTFKKTVKFVATIFGEQLLTKSTFIFVWITNHMYFNGQNETSNSPPHPGKVQIPHPLESLLHQMHYSPGTETLWSNSQGMPRRMLKV